MRQSLNYLKESPSQTAGPYVHIGCTPDFAGIAGVFKEDLGSRMITGPVLGKKISVKCSVFDGTGALLRDGLIEIWQADAEGFYPSPLENRGNADPNFTGFGRSPCDSATGEFTFETVKPGQVPFPDGRLQAPHITFWIVARGVGIGLHTRMYFEDEEEANSMDPVLNGIELKHRLPTLLAKHEAPNNYHFEIQLQGPNETIFFDV